MFCLQKPSLSLERVGHQRYTGEEVRRGDAGTGSAGAAALESTSLPLVRPEPGGFAFLTGPQAMAVLLAGGRALRTGVHREDGKWLQWVLIPLRRYLSAVTGECFRSSMLLPLGQKLSYV